MTNKSKNLGTAAESAVVKVFKDAGFRAKRLTLHGSKDVGDIDIGLDDVVIEVKGGAAAERASDGQVDAWLGETAKEVANAGASFGVLVVKRKGIGPANAGRWWAILTDEWHDLLTGNPFPVNRGYVVRLHLDTVVALLDNVRKRGT